MFYSPKPFQFLLFRASCPAFVAIAKFHGVIGGDYPYAANRCLEQLSKMFQLASTWGYVPENNMNPAKGIQAFKEQKRDRWIKPDELPRLAKAINNEDNFYGSKALWLYLLLGVRREELLKAKWKDIDWDRNELRLPETKAGTVLQQIDKAMEWFQNRLETRFIIRSKSQTSDGRKLSGLELAQREEVWEYWTFPFFTDTELKGIAIMPPPCSFQSLQVKGN